MKSKGEILKTLKLNKQQLKRFGVARIGLFGSCLGSEQNDQSDIDLLIDFDPDKENFYNLMEVNHFLEQLFRNQKIDLVTKNGLSPHIGPHILKNVEYA